MRAHLTFVRNRGVAGISIVQAVALVPPLVVAVFERGAGHAGLLALALFTVLAWDAIFSAVRRRPFVFGGLTAAFIVVIFIPADLPAWQLVLTLTLGLVLGEHVFGGRGFGFLSPAAVCLSLLMFSFPQVQLEPVSESVALAALPGAALLLAMGLISPRVVAGALAGVVGFVWLTGHQVDPFALGTAVVCGLIFMICDPTSAASTNPGRWIFGLLAGLLMGIFSGGGEITSAGVVFASLTASIFAPLIDHLVVLAHAERRRRSLV